MTSELSAAAVGKAERTAKRMSVGLLGIGVLHFLAPKPFDGIIPPQLPGSPRTYTYVSGAAEIAVAGALAVPRTRKVGALAAVLLFISVFPGNIQMALDWWRDPKQTPLMKAVALARLPLQIPMITTALSVHRNTP
ncbi:DoxX family protein [Aldersonia kunmingensis]|uniref:DoxX family protein n=1 Tax=Aldersonia kunmingensis TaxID=408066 RepID=UPI000830A1E0|nr:hypothetical protein [Aldersonia kunmingensis]